MVVKSDSSVIGQPSVYILVMTSIIQNRVSGKSSC
uniref:Uncharacterized protein n=1 Tax=Anguilla anguilla TaxID=7936 RepID=A0A0E9QIJ6_ANGAN